MGEALTAQSQLTCPHGGSVSLSAGSALLIDGMPAVAVTDQATVEGCGEEDSCATVQWGQCGLLIVDGVEVVTATDASSCITAAGSDGGPPVVQSGCGGTLVGW